MHLDLEQHHLRIAKILLRSIDGGIAPKLRDLQRLRSLSPAKSPDGPWGWRRKFVPEISESGRMRTPGVQHLMIRPRGGGRSTPWVGMWSPFGEPARGCLRILFLWNTDFEFDVFSQAFAPTIRHPAFGPGLDRKSGCRAIGVSGPIKCLGIAVHVVPQCQDDGTMQGSWSATRRGHMRRGQLEGPDELKDPRQVAERGEHNAR